MKNKRFYLSWIGLISWLVFIFYMSNQVGEVSSSQSNLVIVILEKFGLVVSEANKSIITFCIRKSAHFTEYFILYLLVFNVLRFYLDLKRSLIYSLFFVFLYACTDEFHQSFIPGRSPGFRDVLIDTSGGIVSLIVKILYIKMSKKRKKA